MVSTERDDRAELAPADLARLNETHVISALAPLAARPLENVVMFERASGVRLWDTHGREWLDGFAGSQHVPLGFGRPEITSAVAASLEELSAGNLFSGRSHPRVAHLASRLADVTPPGLDRFFFSVTGADAVETAIAIVRYANAIQGRPEKHHIIGRTLSYHGLNYGGRSITGQPAAWEGFGPLLPGFSHIDYPMPDCPDAAAQLEHRILELGPENVAAFLAEPISFPSGGMAPPDTYWPQIREICSRYDVLLVVDEVATGFGRTGELFAISNWNVAPDVMTMAKAINNGAIPMSAVGVTQEVYERMVVPGKVFWHGFTGGGNPAACSAALATLKIFEDEQILEQTRSLSGLLRSQLESVAARSDLVRGVRVTGALTGIDFVDGIDGVGPGEVMRAAAQAIDDLRVLVRGYGTVNTIIFSPAATATEREITEMVARIDEAIQGIKI